MFHDCYSYTLINLTLIQGANYTLTDSYYEIMIFFHLYMTNILIYGMILPTVLLEFRPLSCSLFSFFLKKKLDKIFKEFQHLPVLKVLKKFMLPFLEFRDYCLL